MSALELDLFGGRFQNPVLLAAGTCGFGMEIDDVVDLESLGGFVTKSVTVEPRAGNAAPRVAEFGAGMVNSVGLANPGLEAVRREKLPWIRRNVKKARVLVSVAGHTPAQYERLVRGLAQEDGFLGFELNLSCPNDDRLGGRPFVLDADALRQVVSRCRAVTDRPLLVKLAPNDPDLEKTVRAAEGEGADGLTLVNTLPGLVFDPGSGRPALGAGEGGMSGRALRPAGVRAVAVARRVSSLPLLGVGGIVRVEDAIQYLRAGASLVQVGTASFAAPRAAERIARELPDAVIRAGLPWPPRSTREGAPRSAPPDAWTGADAETPAEAAWRR
jgi:dihydroorotate dehydrogenase (NAD+) catalytic subunit